MTVSFQLITPGRSWLHTQPQRDRDRVARHEIRRQATRALAEIDQAVADRARSAGSRCGQCLSPIPTEALGCNACGLNFITGQRAYTNADLRHAVFEYGVEHGPVGPVVEIR